MNYTEVKEYIKQLQLPHRGNCPKCYGENTFIVNASNGVIKYYCFRSSCNLKGVIDYEISIDELRNNNNIILPAINSLCSSMLYRAVQCYQIPSYFISPLQNRICYNYLNRYNLIDFYSQHVDRIKYDPKENRCVFILKDHEGVIKGAVGRSLDNSSSNIRWNMYLRMDGCPYYLKGNSRIAIIVEDCVSASYLISADISAISILGTNISDETIKYLLIYRKLYILLDDDATGKSLILQKQLSAYKETIIIPTKIDPKYFNITQLNELKGIIKDV